jgi:hypothetical protein
MNRKTTQVAILASMLAFGGSAWSQIPATAPYNTDPQNEYVQDQTSDGISNLNMVLCIVHAMSPSDMVNAGPYVALIDKNKCDTKSRASASNSTGGSSGSTATPDYINAVVNVTQATNADPMYARVWMTLTEQGHVTTVYAYLSATQAPSATMPYGAFHLDYLGKVGGVTQFNGFIDAASGALTFYESDANQGQSGSSTALALTGSSSTSSGSGSMAVAGGGAFDFAFDANSFVRKDANGTQCFDRSKANAERSVWRFGTYNRNDGTRVDVANPGFPVTATYAGASYYGFASYWGINFQGLDLNTIADAQPIPSLTVTDQRPGNTTTYNVSKIGGKLTKFTQHASTLLALDGIPFNFFGDLTGQTTGNPAVTGFGSWLMQWNHSSQTFTVIGTQVCGNNGCVVSSISPAATVNLSALSNVPVNGWSDSFGGNISIPPSTGAAHADTDAVYFYTQSTVTPGSSGEPTALYCLSQCPTAAALSAFPGGGSTASPFGANTDHQWFSAPGANTVTYAFGATGLVESSASMVLEQASQYPSGSMYAQNGIMTGRLFDTALASSNCPNGMPAGTVCEPGNPQAYYQWQTGPNQWSQSLWLTKTADSSVVAFDPPVNLAYVVPTGAAYGSWAGKTILLQFNGFGNLFGIPGSCVSPADNSPVDCSTPNSRYVPVFSIPDGDATMTVPGSTPTPLIIKALDAELRLKKLLLTDAACTVGNVTLTTQTVPTGGTHDPSSPSDAHYLGTEPTPASTQPKVIDGVLQH